MYFLRFALFALSTIVPALAIPQLSGSTGGICPVSFTEYCCGTLLSLEDLAPGERQILSAIGLDIDRIVGEIGFNCQTVNSASGGTCSTNDVCCQANLLNGIIAFPCRNSSSSGL